MKHEPSTGALLREVGRLHAQLQRDCVAYCRGTTVTQCTVLTELGRSGEVTLAELSRRVGFDKSWTSRGVEILVQEGLVNKVPSLTDRRTVRISLTEAGEQRLRELNSTLNGLADQAMERIPSEQHSNVRQALEMLQKALLELTEEEQLPSALDMEGDSSCSCD